MAKSIPTYYPEVGEHLYLRQHTSDSWINQVKHPYTVIKVTKDNVWVQECNLIFNGPRYYDTLPDRIEEDPEGSVMKLKWTNCKKYPGYWIDAEAKISDYPYVAYFGTWKFSPYLN